VIGCVALRPNEYVSEADVALVAKEMPIKTSPVLALVLLLHTWAWGQAKPVFIQPEIQLQRMEGFGISIGSGCASEIAALSGIERARLLDLLFGAEGARINILRNEISWAGKRLPITHPLYLRGFVYNFGDEESESSQYLVIREAQKRTETIVNSCVWSPPSQWKSNGSVGDGGELLSKHYENFAEYLLGHLYYYKRMRNQDFQLLSLQNSPNLKQSGRSCLWSAEQLRDFVKIMGARLKQQGYSTKIMLPEVEWEQAEPYVQAVLDDSEARGIFSHLAVHSFPLKPSSARIALKEISKKQNLKLWQTEFVLPKRANSSDMDEGLQLAAQMLEDLSESECHAWLYGSVLPASSDWQGLLEKSDNSFKVSKSFWALSQFSRFLPRNSVRISAQRGTVPVIAFRNPEYNGMIVVMINSTPEPVTETIELRGWTMERMVAHRTSEKEDCAQVPLAAESGTKRSLVLEPRSITTLVTQIRRVRTG
jgi:glucuronoarabinoxylan endo-1,4-beta-xylanase